MKKMNSYSHLLVRLSAILVVVLIAAFVNSTDARARAESGNSGQSEASVVSGPSLTVADIDDEPDVSGIDAITDDGYGFDSEKNTDKDDAAGSDAGTEEDGSQEDMPDEISAYAEKDRPMSETGTPENGSEGYDIVNEEPDDGLTEEEKEQLRLEEEAARLAAYKQTQEYIDSLLVTHPDHYNAQAVENARSIPTESDNDRYLYITGFDKKTYKVGNMPEGFRNDAETRQKMVTIDVPVWKMRSNGERYSSYWPITIHEKLADSIRCIFSDIYLLDIQFPFNYLGGYYYRKVGGSGLVNSKLMSTHAFGVALDINMGQFDNDYFLGKGNDLRNKNNPYCIPDEVIKIFEDYGWFWGGNYDICADTMHFQYFELGFLQYESSEPFPILYRGAENMDPKVVKNLVQRLMKLGYLEKEAQSFSKKVDKAVKKFQKDHGLEPDGIVDYETWEPLINLTHYMNYVF